MSRAKPVTKRDVAKAAWLEWLVTHQTSGGNGGRYIPQVVDVPGWFASQELGMSPLHGPSILWTAEHLDEINRAHRHLLACPERPKPPKRKEQDVANQRRREWRAILEVPALRAVRWGGGVRQHGRIDANQPQIVKALRAAGASVQSLADMGRGVPDLLVGWRGVNLLFELKDGAKPPSARRLTPDEKLWHQRWNGDVSVVESVDEALQRLRATDQSSVEESAAPELSRRIDVDDVD